MSHMINIIFLLLNSVSRSEQVGGKQRTYFKNKNKKKKKRKKKRREGEELPYLCMLPG